MATERASSELRPVIGEYRPPRSLRRLLPATRGFNRAFKRALDAAAKEWGPQKGVPTAVEFAAEIQIWNPGGVGAYRVTLIPGG
jgi:hypothetical protein